MNCKANENQPTDNGAGQAAHTIVQLINSRPQSPRYEEIVAIIERHVVHPMRRQNVDACGLDEYGPDLTIALPNPDSRRWP